MGTEAFSNGLDSLEAQDYSAAMREFEAALKSTDERDDQYYRIASFLGLARVLTGDDSGLLMCRDAAGHEKTYGDVFLNAACAEWHSDQRKRAIYTAYRGLDIDPGHQQLNKAATLLDSREKNIISFLDRDHIFNRVLGRFYRKNPRIITVHDLLY